MKTKLDLDLVGKDGNAFFLLGYFRSQAKKAGWTPEEIEETTAEAKNGDYDHLLQVLLSV
jgi:hypothetical protein